MGRSLMRIFEAPFYLIYKTDSKSRSNTSTDYSLPEGYFGLSICKEKGLLGHSNKTLNVHDLKEPSLFQVNKFEDARDDDVN